MGLPVDSLEAFFGEFVEHEKPGGSFHNLQRNLKKKEKKKKL